MVDAIELMHSAFERLASGQAANHPRRRLILPTGSVLHYMAGSDGQYFGAKIYSSHPRHGAHFLFLLYRAADAEPLALVEANHLGQIRTGAASGLATRFLAAENASSVAILGSGFQAATQLEAMLAVRKIARRACLEPQSGQARRLRRRGIRALRHAGPGCRNRRGGRARCRYRGDRYECQGASA